jgi:hypothetical protein
MQSQSRCPETLMCDWLVRTPTGDPVGPRVALAPVVGLANNPANAASPLSSVQ